MKNADKPINPIVSQYGFPTEIGVLQEGESKLLGLTKREYFTAMAMQGIIPHIAKETFPKIDVELIAELSVKITDETLKQLEKSE